MQPGRILSGPSVSFGRQWGPTSPEVSLDMDLFIGRELLIFALLVTAVVLVIWALAVTRRPSR